MLGTFWALTSAAASQQLSRCDMPFGLFGAALQAGSRRRRCANGEVWEGALSGSKKDPLGAEGLSGPGEGSLPGLGRLSPPKSE